MSGAAEGKYRVVQENSSHHSGRFTIDDDDDERDREPHPTRNPTSSWVVLLKRSWEVVSFGWILPLLQVGYSRRLEPSDLYPLDAEDSAREVYSKFKAEWRSSSSLALSLSRAFGWPFLGAGLLKLVHDCFLFVGPQMLNKLIKFFKDPSQPLSNGLYCVAVLGVTQFLMSVFLRQYFYYCFRVGMRLRSAIITSVFAKTLILSTEVFTRRSSGQIQNLMAVDSTRLQDLTPYLHSVWFSAFQIVFALYLLWQEVGAVPSLAAISVIITTIPLTAWVSNRLQEIQKKVSAVRDERIKVAGEMVLGIKVIKFQAWESRMEAKVNDLRDQELSLFLRYVLTQALSGTLFTVIPLIVSITTFATFTLQGRKLDVATALTSLSLLELLRFPMFMLPNTLNSVVEAKVSLDRVQAYLEEHERLPISPGALTRPGISLYKTSAVWEGVGRRHVADDTTVANYNGNASDAGAGAGTGAGAGAGLSQMWSRLNHNLGSRAFTLLQHLFGVNQASAVSVSQQSQSATSNPMAAGAESAAAAAAWSDLTAPQYELLLSLALATENEEYIERLESRVKELELEMEKEKEKEIDMGRSVTSDEGNDGDKNRDRNSNSNETRQRILTLSRVLLDVQPGNLVAVVGPVASGKSSLVAAVLGDLRLLYGSVACRGSIAYVGQKPFIFNDTVKGNVLNGQPLDENKYEAAVKACALLPDFDALPDGDRTEIGERGINLSGGQKARVALARAMYADANVYLLDDVLSAVDSHTATHITEHCLKRLVSRRKAVLLVTNALQVLPLCSHIIVLDQGRVVKRGTWVQLRDSNDFKLMLAHQSSLSMAALDDSLSRVGSATKTFDGGESGLEADGEKDTEGTEMASARSLALALADEMSESEEAASVSLSIQSRSQVQQEQDQDQDQKQIKGKVQGKGKEGNNNNNNNNNKAGTLIEAEEREQGHVKRHVYWVWLSAAGGSTIGGLLIFLFTACEAASMSTSIWLSHWSEHYAEHSTSYFLGIFIALNCAIACMMLLRELTTRLTSWSAGQRLFRTFLTSVVHAPMSFFDTTPLGRVNNRFSKDVYTIDEQLPQTVRWYLQSLTRVGGAILYVCVVSPLFILGLGPIVAFYLATQRYYIKTSRELARLDSISRSPIYAMFSETLDGLSTIRAFRMEHMLTEKNDRLVDANQRAYYLTFSSNCWLGFRLELVSALIVVAASLLAVLGRPAGSGAGAEAGAADAGAGAGKGTSTEMYAGLAGLAISMTLNITQSIAWSVRMASDLESQMVSVERVQEYTTMEVEAAHYIDGKDPPPSWPAQGSVVFEDVKMRYRPGLPLVLKGVSFNIQGRQKVGIVGRTGSGKSSLLTALLRLVEVESSGRIVIDGIDVASIGLNALRSRISIVPQDPVLFAGSVRLNLDPFSQHTDVAISQALQMVGLTNIALLDLVEDGGQNYSVGQRQMMCISRALLANARIIVMDEATAAIDTVTDELIQRAIRTNFCQSTCLTIAHRLNTVLDSDVILVMDDGFAAEFDTPAALLAKPGSLFSELVNNWREETE